MELTDEVALADPTVFSAFTTTRSVLSTLADVSE